MVAALSKRLLLRRRAWSRQVNAILAACSSSIFVGVDGVRISKRGAPIVRYAAKTPALRSPSTSNPMASAQTHSAWVPRHDMKSEEAVSVVEQRQSKLGQNSLVVGNEDPGARRSRWHRSRDDCASRRGRASPARPSAGGPRETVDSVGRGCRDGCGVATRASSGTGNPARSSR